MPEAAYAYFVIFAVAGYVALVVPMVRAIWRWLATGRALDAHIIEQMVIWMSAVMLAIGYQVFISVSSGGW
ncbi:MAG: hypothetical protein AAF714_08425 [Pseudomonadota bacterium]